MSCAWYTDLVIHNRYFYRKAPYYEVGTEISSSEEYDGDFFTCSLILALYFPLHTHIKYSAEVLCIILNFVIFKQIREDCVHYIYHNFY